jgi:hypothetical protein
MHSGYFIFEEEKEFIEKIHLESETKIQVLSNITGEIFEKFESKATLERITNSVMKVLKKSDRHFLLWLFACGQFIKMKFNGKWALVKMNNKLGNYYEPIIIDNKNEIWRIGESCRNFYYLKNRASGIHFELFYKLDIERYIYRPKLGDAGFKFDEIIFLE